MDCVQSKRKCTKATSRLSTRDIYKTKHGLSLKASQLAKVNEVDSDLESSVITATSETSLLTHDKARNAVNTALPLYSRELANIA